MAVRAENVAGKARTSLGAASKSREGRTSRETPVLRGTPRRLTTVHADTSEQSAKFSASLPESSGGKSLYDVLTTEDINRETGLSKAYIQKKCKAGEIRCITKGGGQGQGHGYRVMRKDFVEWWDRQPNAGNQGQ